MTEGKTLSFWEQLAAPFPPEKIKQRQGSGGKMFDYIEPETVHDRLDAVAPGWSLAVVQMPAVRVGERDGKPVVLYSAVASLSLFGPDGDGLAQEYTRSATGEGSSPKQADTDAFKRAAMRFGVGLELYRSEKPKPKVVRIAPQVAQTDAPAASSPAPTADDPSCPKCGGRLWDNRIGKRNPKAPDFKCRDRSCDGVIWPPKDPSASPSASSVKPGRETQAASPEWLNEREDEIPF